MGTINRYVGVFALIVAVILIISAVGPALSSPSPQGATKAPVPDSFQPDNIVAEEADETGSPSIEVDADSKVIVIDSSHSNSYSRAEIQPLVDTLVENGHEVRFYGSSGQQSFQTATLNDSLAQADAFVSIAPGSRFSDDEVRGLESFEERGGRVLLLAEPDSLEISTSGGLFGFGVSQVSTSLTALSTSFGMNVDTGYLYNMYERQNNYRNIYAEPSAEGNLTEGVDRVMFPQATAVSVDSSNVTTALTAIDRTQLSSTREGGTYAVAAQNGNVTLVADSSFIAPTHHQVADNEVLLGNVAEFLVTGNKTAVETTTPTPGGGFGPGPGPSPGPGPGPTPTPPSTPSGG